ncbi:hypothetical protein PF003_g37156 [Phytophthora fragariae]|nr:hypothetical protein PF003_g37156 [Phytophthora fragariae]
MGKPLATDVQVVTSGDDGMEVRKGAASATGTWGDKVRATTPPPENITAEMARTAHMLEGVWNPLHIKQLTNTLLTDWNSPENEQWTQNEIAMRLEAQAPAQACCDESIRCGTERENEIMAAYLGGRLDLPHPPNFLKEILIGEHRAMVEDMHEAYHNAVLTAVVPTTVKLTRTAAHAVIFKELFMANTDKRTGHDMMRAFQRDVKRMTHDGIQTLQVVFYSRTAANRWEAKALRLQKAVIVLKDTQHPIGQEGTGLYTAAQLEIQYAVRVYGGDCLGLTALARAFASFTDAKVLDVDAELDCIAEASIDADRGEGKSSKSKPVPNHRTESKGKRQNGKMHRNPAKRFEQFQRHEALGQFGVLADTDSDEGDSDDMDVDDEAARYESPTSRIGQDDAPYAFPATQDASMVVEVGQTAAPAHAVDAPMTTVEPMEGVEDGDQTTHRDKVKKGSDNTPRQG